MPRIGARHHPTHENAGNDEIDATGLTGRCDFFDRGDPSDFDFTITDFVTDGNAHDLDLSSIVPRGAKAVLIRVGIIDDAVSSWIYFYKKGNTNQFNASIIYCQVSNVAIWNDRIVIPDSNSKISYITYNTTFSGIYVIVAGWWI